jgi:hypothetical protein
MPRHEYQQVRSPTIYKFLSSIIDACPTIVDNSQRELPNMLSDRYFQQLRGGIRQVEKMLNSGHASVQLVFAECVWWSREW